MAAARQRGENELDLVGLAEDDGLDVLPEPNSARNRASEAIGALQGGYLGRFHRLL